MKTLLQAGIFLFISFWSFAQQPDGKLFVLTEADIANGKGYLGKIDYPVGTYQTLFNDSINDFIATNDYLVTCHRNIYKYDPVTLLKEDSIQNADAYKIAVWKDTLAVISQVAPYCSIYDQDFNLIGQVDTTELPYGTVDLVADNGILYLLRDTSIMLVELKTAQVITTIPTPHPFPFGGYNTYLLNDEQEIYIIVDYATGAIRFSLMKLNKSTLVVDTILHRTGFGTFVQPLLTEDKIYMAGFDSHYDITNDTLYEKSLNGKSAVAFDGLSGSVFLAHPTPYVSYYQNSTYSDSIGIPGVLRKAVFTNRLSNSIHVFKESGSIELFPNPANTDIQVNTDFAINRIKIYAADGSLKHDQHFYNEVQRIKLSIEMYDPGLYVMEVLGTHQSYTSKLLKQ